MGDSNLVAVDFVINPTQVPPGLWMCVPAQCACLGWRKGCRVVRRSWELCWALKQAHLHQTPSCSVFRADWSQCPGRGQHRTVFLLSRDIHVSRAKHGARKSPSLQIHVLPPGSSHSSYQSYGEKTEAKNMAKKIPQSPPDPSSWGKGWTL